MKLLHSIKRGRVFYRYLLSYFLILLIPLVLTFVLFNRAQGIVETESSRANEQLLDQMKIYLDGVMDDILTTSHLISYNERVQGFIYLNPPVGNDENYRAYQIYQDFRVYYGANSSIIKFFIYIDALDMIISHSGFYSSREFYIAQQSAVVEDDTDYGYADWMQLFAGPSRRKFVVMNTETETELIVPTIALVSPLPVGERLNRPKGYMVIEIDLNKFRTVFENTTWSASSILLIHDREAGILISSNPEISFDTLMREKQKINAFQNGDLVSIDDEPYVINLRESGSVGSWTYVSLVPAHIYARQFNTLTQIAVSAFALCFVIGVALIYWSASQRYKPVRRLLTLLTPDEEGNVSLRSDEFKVITRTLQSTLAEDQRLRHEADIAGPILAQRYLRQLLTGEVASDQDRVRNLDHYGVRLPYHCLILVLLGFEMDSEGDKAALDQGVREFTQNPRDTVFHVIRNLDISRSDYYYPENDLTDTVGILINRDLCNTEDAYGDLVALKQRLEGAYGVILSIGISSARPKEDDFKILFREADIALRYRLIKGRRLPIRHEDIVDAIQAYYYPLEQEQKLINSIKAGNAAVADAILEDVYLHNFGDSLMSLPMAHCLMFDLISTMVKSIDAVLGEEMETDYWHTLRPIHRMLACKSFEQLRGEMRAILEQVCRTVRNSQKSHNDRLKDEILAHIHENYQDQNLCPDSIAETFNRNKAYLSRFFREQTAVGISTYIKQYRVSKAKPLLLNDEVTIADLAWNVGFSGSNAFIRAFKEIEGMTPGQYKASRYAI